MEKQELINLLDRLISLSKENEIVEFKKNFHSKEEIGERISAISNSACLLNQPYGYLVYGVENDTHKVVGTTFSAKSHMVGNEELELWLLNRLNPKIDFLSYEFDYQEGVHISIYKIPAAENAVAPLVHAWGFGKKNQEPKMKSHEINIDSIKSLVGYDKISLIDHHIVKQGHPHNHTFPLSRFPGSGLSV